jgi:hypothetical protein
MSWWRRKEREHDLDRELRSHVELEAEHQRNTGVPSDDARYAAKRALGNMILVKEEVRSRGHLVTVAYPLVVRMRKRPARAIRAFSPADTIGRPEVAVINETKALRYFGKTDRVGRHFGWSPQESDKIEIIGVVKDARYDNLREETPPMVYTTDLTTHH